MRYFEMNADHHEKWVQFSHKEDMAHLVTLDASTSTDCIPQSTLRINWIEGDDQEKKWLDMHMCSPVFSVLSLKAAECLEEFFEPNGFLISTKGLNDNYTIYNVTTVITGAFDWNKSDIKGNHNHLSEINKAALYKEKIRDTHIFKLAESRVDVFVSEIFKNKVEQCGLSGFIFEDVILL